MIGSRKSSMGAAAVLLLVGMWAHAPIAQATAPNECTVSSPWSATTTCVPIQKGPWQYLSAGEPFSPIVSGPHSSLAAFSDALINAYNTQYPVGIAPCSPAVVGTDSVYNQSTAYGILIDSTQTLLLHLWTWDGYTCQQPDPDPTLGTVRKIRNLSCPDTIHWTFAQETNGTWSCACIPGMECSIPRCAKGGLFKGDPCDITIGNLREEATDYAGADTTPLRFRRSYNSLTGAFQFTGASAPTSFPLGVGWWATYFQKIQYTDINDSGRTGAFVYRPDGSVLPFTETATGFYFAGEISDTLVWTYDGGGNKTGWLYTTANADKEAYDLNGRLLSITNRGGQVQTLSYNAYGYLASVTDSFGRTLTFDWDDTPQARVSSVTDPSGANIEFTYDANNNLSTVTYPDGKVVEYLYELSVGSNQHNLLTGEIDENGNRYKTWDYASSFDGTNMAISSQLAGGVDNYTFTYNSDGSRVVVDPLGTSRTYSSEFIGMQRRYTGVNTGCNGCGDYSALSYDANGNISSKTDFNGNVTHYSHDLTRNLELSRTEAYGTGQARTITTQWHSILPLPILITEPNRTTAFTHDSSGNVLTKTVTDTATSTARTWTYTYNSYGQVLTENGPRTDVTDVTTYTYYGPSATCTATVTGASITGCRGQVQTITNALSHTTTFNEYNAHGQSLKITDPNGVATTLIYDVRQRLTSHTVGSETTTITYWPTGLLKKVTLPDSSYLQYTYDNAHRLTRIDDAAGNYVVYTLDAMGNRTAENLYDPSSFLTRTHSRVFNSLNQLWKDVTASGSVAQTTVFGYDNNGNQTTINAPLSRNTTNQYDELNRLKQITDPGTGVTQLGYDANDNLASITDPRSKVTSYTYTGFGDVETLVSPDTGTTTNTYDSGGNLKTSTDARSAITTYTLDALNRVTSAAYKIGATTDQTIAFGYDTGTNGIGRLTTASDANHSMNWSYDAQGRVTSKGQTIGAVTKTVSYGYTNGNLTSMTTPSGQAVVYSYNSNHQVTSITINGSTTLLSSVLYDPFGPIRGWTWGNSTIAVRTYDTDGKVTQVDSAGLKTYAYDDAFRITGITDTVTAANSYTYGYNNLDRLTSAVKTGTTRGWTYDASGNRLTQTGTGASTYTISSTNNRISSITGGLARTYSYDAAGNVTGYTFATATYNNRGRMKTLVKSGVTATYVYNALGQRIKQSGGTPGTVLYMYDEEGHLIGEYSSTGALVQETVWLGDTPVATIRPGTPVGIYYVHTDHLDTPRRISRPSDNKLMWTWYSDPFGSELPNENPASGGTFKYNLRFPGQLYDSHAGLHYNYFRDYDPAIGRYAESDPLGLDGGINPYAYVDNDPVSWYDDDGLEPKGGHTTGKSESTRGRHEKGEARRGRDQREGARGGEKGDKVRRPPLQKPPGTKGPWPSGIGLPFMINPCLWAPELMPPGSCGPGPQSC